MQVEWSEQRMERPFQSPGDIGRGWKKRGRSTLTQSSDADSKIGRKRVGTK